jgi:hypothetical protein
MRWGNDNEELGIWEEAILVKVLLAWYCIEAGKPWKMSLRVANNLVKI